MRTTSITAAVILTAVTAVNLTAAQTGRMFADTASREVYGCSRRLVEETSGQGFLVGFPEDSPEYPACVGLYGQSNAIWAFRLPELPEGKIIANARFYVYYIQHFDKNGVVRYGPAESLYAIGPRSGSLTSPITPDDHFVGAYGSDTTDCTPIQQNFSGDLTIHPVWKTTDFHAGRRLTTFLQDCYLGGAQAGDWVLLRQNCESTGKATTREHFGDSYYLGGANNAFIEYEIVDIDDVAEVPYMPELTPGLGNVYAPIRHKPYYLHERELYGYNPRFEINSVTFGPGNRPYIRGENGVLTLNEWGGWTEYDITDPIKNKFPSWNGRWTTFGPVSEDRIVFDSQNDAYVIVAPQGYGYVLLYSHDLCRTWQVYTFPESLGDVRIEFNDSFNRFPGAPPILARTFRPGGGANYLKLFVPVKNPNGTLTINPGVRIAAFSIVGNGLNAGKGASNLTATLNGKTHIVFSGRYQEPGDGGTPQYIATYDHETGTVGEIVYLGSAGNPLSTETDGHNWPAITLDSQGYIHVILAAHGLSNNQCFRYTRSMVPNSSTDGWTSLKNLQKGLTYPSFLCGPDDTLHLIARNHWEPEMRLKHQTKSPGGEWSARKDLVIPWDALVYSRAPYVHYAAKFNVDRLGRLFLVYYNKRNLNIGLDEFNPLQYAAFLAKYPCDPADDELDPHHDPAMLFSNDGGSTWRLALTDDFAEGMQ